jgi:hypothetical protein
MYKRKVDMVSEETRERLAVNREGALTTRQWLDLVTEPLTGILLLIAPAILIIGLRVAPGLRISIPLLVIIGLGLLAWMLIARARRYARMPISFGRFFADVRPRPMWQFWRPTMFYRENDDPIIFNAWQPPRAPLRFNAEYLIYYMEDGKRRTILSIAPADHEEAKRWLPTPQFHERYNRRSGRRIR